MFGGDVSFSLPVFSLRCLGAELWELWEDMILIFDSDSDYLFCLDF